MSVASLRRDAASERPAESMPSSQAKLQAPSAGSLSKVPRGSPDPFLAKLRTQNATPSTAGINAALTLANANKVAASTPTLSKSPPTEQAVRSGVSKSTAKLSGGAVDGTGKTKSHRESASQPSLLKQIKQQTIPMSAHRLAADVPVSSRDVLKSTGSILYDDDAAARAVEEFEREEDEAALEALNAFEQERGQSVSPSHIQESENPVVLNSKEAGSLNDVRKSSGSLLYDDEAAERALDEFEHQNKNTSLKSDMLSKDGAPKISEVSLMSATHLFSVPVRSSVSDVRNSAGNLLYDDEAASRALQEFEQERAGSIQNEGPQQPVSLPAPAQSRNDVRKSSGNLLYDDDAASKALDEFEQDQARKTSVRFLKDDMARSASTDTASINDVRKSSGSLLYDDEAASKALDEFERGQAQRMAEQVKEGDAARIMTIASTVTASVTDVRKSSGSLLYDDEAASKALDEFEQDQTQRTSGRNVDGDVPHMTRIASTVTASIDNVRKPSGSLLYDDEAASKALDEFEQEHTNERISDAKLKGSTSVSVNDIQNSAGNPLYDDEAAFKALDEFEQEHANGRKPNAKLKGSTAVSANDVRNSAGNLLYDDEAASKALDEFEEEHTDGKKSDAKLKGSVAVSANDVRNSAGNLLYDDDAASKALDEFEQEHANGRKSNAKFKGSTAVSANDVRNSAGNLLYDDEAASKALDEFEEEHTDGKKSDAKLKGSVAVSANDVRNSAGNLLYDDEAASKALDEFEQEHKNGRISDAKLKGSTAVSANDVRNSAGNLLYDDEGASKALDEFEQERGRSDAKLKGSVAVSTNDVRNSSGNLLYDDDAASKALGEFEQNERAGNLKDGKAAASANDVRTSSGSLLYDDDAATSAMEEFDRDHGKAATANLKSTTSVSKIPKDTVDAPDNNDVYKSSGSFLYDDEAASRALDEYEHQNESDVRKSSNHLRDQESNSSNALQPQISSGLPGTQLGRDVGREKTSASNLNDEVAPSKEFEAFSKQSEGNARASREPQPQHFEPQTGVSPATRRENVERAESQKFQDEESDRAMDRVKPTASKEELQDASSTDLRVPSNAQPSKDIETAVAEPSQLIQYRSNTLLRKIKADGDTIATQTVTTTSTIVPASDADANEDEVARSQEFENAALIRYQSNTFMRRIMAAEAAALSAAKDVSISTLEVNLQSASSAPSHTEPTTAEILRDSLEGLTQQQLIQYMSNPFLRRIAAREIEDVRRSQGSINSKSVTDQRSPLGSKDSLARENQDIATSQPKSGSVQKMNVAVTEPQEHPPLGSIQRLEAALEEDAAEFDRQEQINSVNKSGRQQSTDKRDKAAGDIVPPQTEGHKPIPIENISHPTEDQIHTSRDIPTNTALDDSEQKFGQEAHPTISIQPETINDDDASQTRDAQVERLPTADDSFRLQPNNDIDDNVSNLELPLAADADSRAELDENRDEEFYLLDSFSQNSHKESNAVEEPSGYDDEEFDAEETPTTDDQQKLGEGTRESEPASTDMSELQAAKGEFEAPESATEGEVSHPLTEEMTGSADGEAQYADDFTKASLEDFFGPDLDDTYREAHEKESTPQMPSEEDQQQIDEAPPPTSQYLNPLPPSGQRPMTGRRRRSRPSSARSSSSSFDEVFHSESNTAEDTNHLSDSKRQLSLESKGALGRRKSRPMAANIAKRRSRADISLEALAVDQDQPLAADVIQDVPVAKGITSNSPSPQRPTSPSLEILNVEPPRESSVATQHSSPRGSVSSLPRLQTTGTSIVSRKEKETSKRDVPDIHDLESSDEMVGQLQQEVRKLKAELHSRDTIMSELLRRESMIGKHYDEAVPDDNGSVNVPKRLALHAQRRAFQIVIGRMRQEISYLKFRRNSPFDPVRDTERLPYLARGDTPAAKNVISSQNHAHFENSAIHKSKASPRAGGISSSLEAIGRPMTAKHGDGDGPEQFTAEERERRKARHRELEHRRQEPNQKDHPDDSRIPHLRIRSAVVGETVEERIRSSPLNKGYHRDNHRSKTAGSRAASDVQAPTVPIIPLTDTQDQSEQRLRQGISVETGSIKNGDRVMVVVDGKRRLGIVKYVGWFDAQPDSTVWLGIALDDAVGRHDGVIVGKRYFSCLERHGFFCKADKAVLMKKDFRMSKTAVPRHQQKEAQ